MAYIGRNPAIGTQKVLDSLESQFNGSLTTFDLRYKTNTIYPPIASALIVSLGGVLQEPGVAYTVASDTITFASAPPTGTDCWILLYTEFGGIAGATANLTVSNNLTIGNELHGPANFIIDPATIGDNTGTVEIKGNLTVQGTQTTVNSTTVDLDHLSLGDDEIANFGTDNDIQIVHESTGNKSVIKRTTTGDLYIQGASGSWIHIEALPGESSIKAAANGTVELYYDNSQKLETTNTGVNVTGALKVNDIASLDSTTLSLGLEGGANGFINTQESLYVNIDSNNDETGKRFEIRHGATDASGTQLFTVLDSGNVGIGQASPLSKLQIENDGEQLRLTYPSIASYIHEVKSNGDYAIDKDGAERLRIDSNGRVGINSTNPLFLLEVNHADEDGILLKTANTAASFINFSDGDDNDVGQISYDHATNHLGIRVNAAERLRINSNGNVNVLHDTESYFSLVKNNAGGNGSLSYNGTVFAINSNSSGADMQLGTNSTPRITIKVGGNVGIGTDNPAHRLEVKSGANGTFFISGKSSTGVDIFKVYESSNGDGNNGMVYLQDGSGNTDVKLSTNGSSYFKGGNVGIGTDSPFRNLSVYDASNAGVEIKSGTSGQSSVFFTDTADTNIGMIGYFHTDDSMFFRTNDGERLRITSTGNVLVNHDSSDGSGKLQVFTNSQDGIDILGFSSGATNGGRLTFYRSKSAGVGNFSEVADGDSLGRIDWRGYNDDGTANNLGATIEALVSDDVDSTTDMPSDLIFKTSSNGSSSPTERLRIKNDGKVSISSDGTTDGLLTIKGNSDAITTPSIRLLDGTDTREVSISNTAGDFVATTHGTDNNPHGQIKIFESGIISMSNGGASASFYERLRIDTEGDILQTWRQDALIGQKYQYNSTDYYGGLEIDMASSRTLGIVARSNDTRADIFFKTGLSTTATEKMRIMHNGNVGIGTGNAVVKLDVDGTLQLRAVGNYTTYATRIYSRLDSTHCSVIESYLNNSTAFEMMGTYADSGGANPRIVLASGGQNVGINTTNPGYNLEVNGSFAATTKSFIIDHPTKPGMKLRHGSLEGPENGVYVRGRSHLEVINLPDYWTGLVDPDSITVTLTPIGPSGAPRVERIENNKVYVFSEDSRPLDYFYMINAERVDVAPLEVEIPE